MFADMLEAMLSPVVHLWQQLEKGFRVDGRTVRTHFIWADNVYITATDEAELKEMVMMASAVLAQWGFRWKPSSLVLSFLAVVDIAALYVGLLHK